MKPAATVAEGKSEVANEDENVTYAIHDIADQKIEHVADGGVVRIARLERCQILIPNETGGISLNGLKSCVVIATQITASAMIKDCSNCVFALKMKQLRIHDTVDTDFYISVVGNPIIENCHSVRFAPLFGDDSGPWNDVKDFNCSTTAEASPNWHIVPVEEQKIPRFDK
jgi:hypothetical protein